MRLGRPDEPSGAFLTATSGGLPLSKTGAEEKSPRWPSVHKELDYAPQASFTACYRAAAQPALALHFLREAVITNLEGLMRGLAPAQLAQLLWTETLASLLAVLVSRCEV